MSHRLPVTFICAALILHGVSAGAQPPPPKRVFPQVIPSPTGRNGYEEIVLACDTLASSRVWSAAREKLAEAPLSLKRQVLADKPVVEALRLLRRGLAKPVYSPRTDLGFDTLLPELAPMRDLARVLAVQQYVFLADGRTGEAVDTARLCLRLGQAVQTDTLISGLVGIAINALCANALGDHLDQLNARDCEQLYRMCLEALAVPDSQARILAIEHATVRREVIALVNKVKQGDLKAVQTTLGLGDQEFAGIATQVRGLPEVEIDRLTTDSLAYIDRHHQRLQDELRKPHWQRQRSQLEVAPPDGPAAAFAGMLLPSTSAVNDGYAKDHARLRLLACHAAILRYRWEQDRLPPDLASLRLGELTIDPFTGQLLEYHQTGARSYSLVSGGAPTSSDNPRAVNGREPVSVTRSQ